MNKLYKSKTGRYVFGNVETNKGIELVGEAYGKPVRPSFDHKPWNLKDNFTEVKNGTITFKNTKTPPEYTERKNFKVNGKSYRTKPFSTVLIKKNFGQIITTYIFFYSTRRDEVSYLIKDGDNSITLHTTGYNDFYNFVTSPLSNYSIAEHDKVTLKF